MRKVFLEKSYTECLGETILRPFSEKSELSVSLDMSKVLYSFFIACQVEDYRHTYKTFSKKQRKLWNYSFLCNAINFEINLIFLIKPVFIRDQKVKRKF